MAGGREEPVGESTRSGLGWLLAARLLLAGLSLGLAVILDRLEAPHGNPAIWGVYWTIVLAFTATVVSGLLAPRTRNPERFATFQVGIDVAIVTSLVYFSGAGESVFTFLYALVVLYGALVLDRTGVGLSVGLAAAGYGLVLFGSALGLLPSLGVEGRVQPPLVLGAYWGFFVGALLMLGMLANTLSAELRRTGAALDRRTHDLHRLRDLHLRTVESIGSGLLTTDESGRVTSFNPEAERITGMRADEARGRPLDEVIPGARIAFEEQADEPHELGSYGRDRIPFRNRRGEELFLGLGASRLRDEAGRDLGRVVIFQDVTRVVSMEHELRQSERLAAVGEMAARIAHEIRNPLASISGSVQILQSFAASTTQPGGPSPEHGRLMDIVVREVDRLNHLIRDFLLYSRPSPVRTERVRLAELVEEVAKMNAGQPDSGLRVELDLDPDAWVIADPSLLKAVVWNLWNNAVEAIGEQGRLAARVLRLTPDAAQGQGSAGRKGERQTTGEAAGQGGLVALEFEDSGPGIAPEVQDQIFEPFFTTKRDGTGLGLATVQRIIEQHGGAIEVASAPGEGTRFRVCLRSTEPA